MTSPRALAIGLAVSAAINVFLIGGLAGMTYVRLTAPAPAPVVAVSAPPLVAARPAAPLSTTPATAPTPATETEVPPPPRRPRVRPAEPQAPPPVAAPPAPVAVLAPPPQGRPPLASAGDVLSPDSRKAFHKALNDVNKKNKPLTQQARAERQAALDAMGQPGYDAVAVARRLGAARSLDLQARGNVEAALATFAVTLSPQERAALADALVRVYVPAKAQPQPSPN